MSRTTDQRTDQHTDQPIALLGLAGTGAEIARSSALTGRPVRVLGTNDLSRVVDSLDKDQRERVLACTTVTTELSEIATAALVVEAAGKDDDRTQQLLRTTAQALPDSTAIAVTSALQVTALAGSVPHPERVVGLRVVGPPLGTTLVEVVRALQTDEATIATVTSFVRDLDREPVVVPDRPGHLVHRLLMPYLNDVVQAYDDGLASARDIDVALELGLGYPSGPLRLLDSIGLDVHAAATTAAYEQTHDPTLAPPPLLTRMVDAGYVGDSAGRGFRVGTEDEVEKA